MDLYSTLSLPKREDWVTVIGNVRFKRRTIAVEKPIKEPKPTKEVKPKKKKKTQQISLTDIENEIRKQLLENPEKALEQLKGGIM